MLISILSLLGYQLGLSTGMTITFFPMIIIAWTIERMSILWEEEGPREVVVQGGGSLLVAVLAYLLMEVPLAGHLSFNFPELNLRSEEHTSELQSRGHLVCRLLLEHKKQ